jgi:glycosyltransferase involved in cell wall biosynthesis
VRLAVVFYELPPEGGGGFTFQETLLRSLRDAEPGAAHEFFFYAAGAAGIPGVTEIPRTTVSIRAHAALRGLRHAQDTMNVPRFRGSTWLERELKRNRIDFVWFASHYWEEPALPFAATVWDLEHARQPWFPEISSNGEWERRQKYFGAFLPKATRIVVSNDALQELVATTYGVLPDRFLQMPFPTPDFAFAADDADRSEALERLGIKRPYLFYPAQFWSHKNHVTLIEALRTLDEYELVLVGSDKGNLDHVKKLVRNAGVADRVHFPGFVTTDDLVALYQGAHALAYMSWFGPENLPPLEALALGCPVICADVPGMQIQLGDAALFVAPTDAAAVAARVRELEQPDVRKRLADRGRAVARSRTSEAYVSEMVRFLDEFEPVLRSWGPAL